MVDQQIEFQDFNNLAKQMLQRSKKNKPYDIEKCVINGSFPESSYIFLVMDQWCLLLKLLKNHGSEYDEDAYLIKAVFAHN